MSLLNSVFHSKKNTTPADEHPYGGFRLMEDQSSEPHDSVFHCMIKGTIIFAATFGVALYSNIDIIRSMCMLMARGALISMACVALLLPAMLLYFWYLPMPCFKTVRLPTVVFRLLSTFSTKPTASTFC